MVKWLRWVLLLVFLLALLIFVLHISPASFLGTRYAVFRTLLSELQLTEDGYEKLLRDVVNKLEDDPLVYYKETKRLVRLASALASEKHDKSKEELFVVAVQLFREREITESISTFHLIESKYPDWCESYSYIGYIMFKFGAGSLDDSIAYLRKAIDCDPRKARYYSFLATVYRHRYKEGGSDSDREEAEKYFQKAIELDPEDINAYNNYANFLVELGHYKEAEEYYRKAIDIYPDHGKPYYNMACLKSLQGEIDVAVEYLEKALERNPDFRYDAKIDPDLDNIRVHPKFIKLIYNIK